MKHRDVRRLLKSAGYEEDTSRGKGGHIVFKKEGVPGIVTVPVSNNRADITPGMLHEIFTKAGIRIDPHNGVVTFQKPEQRLHRAPGS